MGKKVNLWVLYRDATEADMRILDPYGHSIGELSPIRPKLIQAYAFSEDIIRNYIAHHQGLRLYLKKEKHTKDFCTEFERMHLTERIDYYPLSSEDETGYATTYPVPITLSERTTLDNFQVHPSQVFSPDFDYMNMKDKIHGALLTLGYNWFYNDFRFGDHPVYSSHENNAVKGAGTFNELALIQKMVEYSPAYTKERRQQEYE